MAGRARLGLAFGVGTFREREKLTALSALADVLCGNNRAPLKRCLLEKGLSKDVTLTLYDGMQQCWILLEAQDMDPEQEEAVAETLQSELRRLAAEGWITGRWRPRWIIWNSRRASVTLACPRG